MVTMKKAMMITVMIMMMRMLMMMVMLMMLVLLAVLVMLMMMLLIVMVIMMEHVRLVSCSLKFLNIVYYGPSPSRDDAAITPTCIISVCAMADPRVLSAAHNPCVSVRNSVRIELFRSKTNATTTLSINK